MATNKVSPPDKLYFCDPSKNSECTKEMCYKRGGICHKTLHKEYAAEGIVKLAAKTRYLLAGWTLLDERMY